MISSVGSLGSTNAKVAGQTLTLTTTATVEVGNLIYVAIAWDPNNATTNTGPYDPQMACSDSAGNVYMCMGSAQNAGDVHVAHFLAHVRTELPFGATITAKQTFNTTRVAKAMSAWEFSVTSGAFALYDTSTINNTQGADPPAFTPSMSSTREWLLLHALGAEGPNTDAYTWDSDYTQVTGDGTTGGANDSNVHIRAGFRIATLSSDTINVTSDTADRDYAQSVGIVFEYDPSEGPEGLGIDILDDFNRSDEDPLSDGGAWDTTNNFNSTNEFCEVSSNVCKQLDTIVEEGAGSATVASFSGDGEVFATVAALPAVTTNLEAEFLALYLFVDVIPDSIRDAIGLAWKRNFGDHLYLGERVNTVTSDRAYAPRTMTIGNRFALLRIEDQCECWLDEGGGWFFAFARRCVANSNWGAGGKMGVGISNQTATKAALDDFGGGPHGVPQIYRRVSG
jgi:hypothetical protein